MGQVVQPRRIMSQETQPECGTTRHMDENQISSENQQELIDGRANWAFLT